MDNIPSLLKSAGIVGAGGAGFPSYVKASSKADTVVINAAECEPLLHKDIELLEHFAPRILDGVAVVMRATGASRAIIGIKRKHAGTVKKLESMLKDRPGISISPLGDFYPAGDEYCLVYETTRRLIPPGGIPLDVGVVVNNVETCYNIAAADREPLTRKFLTVAGQVKKPVTLRLPLGVSFAEAVALAGGATCQDPVLIDGGPMMGKIVTDFSAPVTKTTGGLIVLSRKHPLVTAKSEGRPVYSKIGRSVCDQCSYCTQLCPRYLLGYAIQPNRVMRTLGLSRAGAKLLNESALLCCECSLCSLYSCPEGLNPRNVCVSAKADLRQEKIGLKNASPAIKSSLGVHPVREYRKVPVSKLIQRLGIEQYKAEAPLSLEEYRPATVRLPLSQHIGAPAKPLVKPGDTVTAGQKIADVGAQELGVPLHASIGGKITAVNAAYIEISAS